MSYVINKIKKLYPDGIVIGLNKQHTGVYNYLRAESIANGFDKISDYLAKFGLTYARKPHEPKEAHDVLLIIEKICALYPTKEITDFSTSYPELYRELTAYVKENDFTIREFLLKFGFKYKGDFSNIDSNSCRRLNDEFDISWAELSRIADVSRQRMDQVMNGQVVNESRWTGKSFSTDEKELLEIMIEDELLNFDSEELKVRIINDCAGNIAIVLKNETEVKCFFLEDIPEDLLIKLKEKRMDFLLQIDFDVLKNCNKVYVMKKLCLSVEGCSDLLTKAKNSHKMNQKEYAEFLGIERFVSVKDNTDSDFINFFEENLIDGEVYISSSPKNQWIRGYASRKAKMSIEEFVEFFGYKKATYDYSNKFEETKKKYHEQLKAFLVEGSDNLIDISNNFQILNNLISLARIHNITLDELLLQIGYRRINTNASAIIDRIIALEKKFADNHDSRGEYDITRFERNKELVEELKSIYDYRCQICGADETYCIKKSDGKNYVEVHHIKPLSESCENEDIDLDVMENMIVVCAHHHKVLHYQSGGYFNLSDKNGLAITNNAGDSIPIRLDYHLRIKNH